MSEESNRTSTKQLDLSNFADEDEQDESERTETNNYVSHRVEEANANRLIPQKTN